jgi:hypothetical protein
VEEAIVRGFGEALGRAPDAEELADAVVFFAAQRASYETTGNHEAAELAMSDFCQVLFGLSEFIYID